MKISAVSLYLIWSLMSSSINQMVNTAPSSSKIIECYSCPRQLYRIGHNFITTSEYYKKCGNKTVKCDTKHALCGITIDKDASKNTLIISVGRVLHDICDKRQIQSNHTITFSQNLNVVECCDFNLCNTKRNLPLIHSTLEKIEDNNFNLKCPDFNKNHKKLYLSDESNNIAKINDSNNLIVSYNNLDKGYVERHAISSTWFAVFQDKNPYKEIMIASLKRNSEGEFILTKSNKAIIKDNNILHITAESLSLCEFKLRDLNIIINKVVTAKNIRLFSVVLSDTGEVPAHARNFIKQLISRHNGTVYNNNYETTQNVENYSEHHNNTAPQKNSLAKLIMLMPIIITAGAVN